MDADHEPAALVVTPVFSPEEKRAVCRGLFNDNAARTAGVLKEPGIDVDLVLRDADGRVFGGIFCDSFLHSLYIDVLWVDERYRGQGYGRALIEAAERTAREHGCTIAHTTTFSYQAPGFYLRAGYEIVGELDGYPDGFRQFFLRKWLRPGAAGEANPDG